MNINRNLSLAVLIGCAILPVAIAKVPKVHGKNSWLIRPGKSIGKIYLGEQQAAVLDQCGAPEPAQEGDAAMGHFWIVWRGKSGHELDVYTVRGKNDSTAHPEQFVRQIRIESPSFHTLGGFHIGSPLASIALKYHEEKVADPALRLLDCRQIGIAFELRQDSKGVWRCSAIVVHPRDRGILEEYTGFRAYFSGKAAV